MNSAEKIVIIFIAHKLYPFFMKKATTVTKVFFSLRNETKKITRFIEYLRVSVEKQNKLLIVNNELNYKFL